MCIIIGRELSTLSSTASPLRPRLLLLFYSTLRPQLFNFSSAFYSLPSAFLFNHLRTTQFASPLFSHPYNHDYSVDKSQASCSNPFMDSNSHFFLRLAEATILRMSFLMLASNFRVGTRFSSFFLPSSNGSLL